MAAASRSGRARWHSKFSFLLAALGSAIGLGNFWRFPALVAKHGGGIFLVPYILSLVLVGVPLLALELGVGQKWQTNVYDAFARMSLPLKGVGIGAALASSLIAVYYMVIIAWTLVYLALSVSATPDGRVPWAAEPASYFYDHVIQLSSGPDEAGTIVGPVLLGLVVGWVLTALCIRKGPESMSWVVYVTVPLPIICLGVLLVRALTLDGAAAGLRLFLTPAGGAGESLADLSMWVDALGQTFFSLGLAVGVMPSYASYNPRSNGAVLRDACTIALGNSSVSMLAGLVVFAVLGHLSHETGVPVEKLSAGGVGLAFSIFPAVLSTLPGARFFSFLFFLMLLTLGIDSAFSLVEAAAAVVADHCKADVTQETIALCISAFLCFMGLGFTSHGGLYYLDIVDHYMNMALLVVGVCECLAVTWLSTAPSIASATATSSVVVPPAPPTRGPHRRHCAQLVAAFALVQRPRVSVPVDLGYDILRTESRATAMLWAALVKYVTPLLLILVSAVGIAADARRPYGGYSLDWRVFGWAFYFCLWVTIVSFAFAPYREPPRAARGAGDGTGAVVTSPGALEAGGAPTGPLKLQNHPHGPPPPPHHHRHHPLRAHREREGGGIGGARSESGGSHYAGGFGDPGHSGHTPHNDHSGSAGMAAATAWRAAMGLAPAQQQSDPTPRLNEHTYVNKMLVATRNEGSDDDDDQ